MMNRLMIQAGLLLVLAIPAKADTIESIPASLFIGPTQDKPGFPPPQSSFRPFDITTDLAFQGGPALAAVAKDVIPGHAAIHLAEFANDGSYGNGSSWIGNSPNSWLKVDLGQTTPIDSIIFGRNRLEGGFYDREPGQFTVSVSLFDAVYANGDDSNDADEYTQVFDSTLAGFIGFLSPQQTLRAMFGAPVSARFVKMTFANAGTAIDEVEIRAVPEPSSIALLGMGGLAKLGCVIRRRRRVNQSLTRREGSCK